MSFSKYVDLRKRIIEVLGGEAKNLSVGALQAESNRPKFLRDDLTKLDLLRKRVDATSNSNRTKTKIENAEKAASNLPLRYPRKTSQA